MPAVSHQISSLLNGVSQQPAIARLPSQLEAQEDCWSNLVTGLARRPPIRHLAKIAGTSSANVASYANCIGHSVNRDDIERYTIVIRNGAIAVYDTVTGVAKTVSTPNGTAYLSTTNPQQDLRVLTVGDYTFIVNRTITVAMTDEVATSYTFAGTVAKMSELAAHNDANIGRYYKVIANSDNPYDSFYTTYLPATYLGTGGAGDATASGFWTEIALPGVKIAFDPATMPHALVSNGDGTFTFKELSWGKREAGDEIGIPPPSFVGRKISDVFFARRRLGFLSGTRINISRGGDDYFNFWREKGAQILATDPIDINEESPNAAGGFHAAVAFNQDVIAFTGKAQFRCSSSDITLSPNTVDVKEVSAYENSPLCRPVSIGDDLFFTVDQDQWAKVNEFILSADVKVATAPGITDHIPNYIPSEIVRLIGSSESKTLFGLSRRNRTAIYTWSHFEQQNERKQSSWSRWNLPPGSTLLDISVDRWLLILVVAQSDGVYLNVINLAPQPTDNGCFYQVHLDRRLDETQVTFTVSGAYSYFTLPFSPETGQVLTIVENIADPGAGTGGSAPNPDGTAGNIFDASASGGPPVTLVPQVGGSWKVSGIYTGRKFFIGFVTPSWFELTEQFAPKAQNAASDDKGVTEDGRLTLQRILWTFDKTAAIASGVWEKTEELAFGAAGPISISGTPSPTTLTTPSIPTEIAFRTSGKQDALHRKQARYQQKINRRSTRAILRLASVDHLPFYVMSARWWGHYSYLRQQV